MLIILTIEVDYRHAVDHQPENISSLGGPDLISQEPWVSSDICHDPRPSVVTIPHLDRCECVVCRVGFGQAAAVCVGRPWLLQKDDVVSFRVGQRQGAVVGRRDLADVGLEDPERLPVVLSSP